MTSERCPVGIRATCPTCQFDVGGKCMYYDDMPLPYQQAKKWDVQDTIKGYTLDGWTVDEAMDIVEKKHRIILSPEMRIRIREWIEFATYI